MVPVIVNFNDAVCGCSREAQATDQDTKEGKETGIGSWEVWGGEGYVN